MKTKVKSKKCPDFEFEYTIMYIHCTTYDSPSTLDVNTIRSDVCSLTLTC